MFEYQAGTSPLEARGAFPMGTFLLFLAIIAAVIAAVYIIIKKRQEYFNSDEFKEKERNRPTTRKDIVKIEKEHNLTKEQGDMLWDICQMSNAKNIIYQLKDNNEISELFRTAYDIYRQEDSSEQKIFDFFTLLYKMETIVAKNKAVTNTKFIPVSTIVFYLSDGGEQLPFPIVKNTTDGFYLEIPQFLFESPRKPKILARSRFTFKTNQGLSYNFVARVIRYDHNNEQYFMVVGHTDNLTSQVQRHFKRDYFERECSFSPILLNKNEENDDIFVYSSKIYQGKCTNLSGGGCCIQTDMPIKEGQNLRVMIPDLNTEENIIGVIKKTRRLPITGYAIHIQFLRISLKSQNRIFSLVYKYEI